MLPKEMHCRAAGLPPVSRGFPPFWPGFVAAARCHWLVRPSAVAAENRLDFLVLLLNWPTRLPLGLQLLQWGKKRGLTLVLAAKIRLHNHFLDGKGLGFNLETFLGIYQRAR